MEVSHETSIFESIDKIINGEIPKKEQHTSSGLVALKKAPNPIIFAESPKFLSLGEPLYPFQFATLRDFFELLCPICNDVSRIRIKDDVPREDQILLNHNVCPACGLEKYNTQEYWYNYNELVGCGGMRGSKSTLAALIAHWLTHEALCCDNLQTKLGLLKNQTIEGAFVAVSSEQAEETVWDHFVNMYEESPWYQDYKKALKNLERSKDTHFRSGDLIGDDAKKYIYFGDRRLRLKALHSNSSSLRGRTRLFAIIDELSHFDASEYKRGANQVYTVMKRSLATLTAAVNKCLQDGQYDIPIARMVSISSPLFTTDKTMRLLDDAKKVDRMYSFHKTVFDMNPTITMEDLQDEFDRDPLGAERDYLAKPPGAENPFIKDPIIIKSAIDIKRKSIFDLEEDLFEVKHQQSGNVFKYIRIKINKIRYNNLQNYYIHCDPGESGDSFCLAIGHGDKNKVVIDGAIEIRPIPKRNRQGLEPRKVHFPSVTDLILALHEHEGMSLVAVSYDKWNSIDQIQRLIDRGILAVSKNLSRNDHIKFLNSMRNGKVSFPVPEKEIIDPNIDRNVPCAKALWELEKLNDDGIKVDHPRDGSNDMIQCYIGVHRLIATPEEIITTKEAKKILMNKQPIYRGPTRSLGRVIQLRR